MVGMFWVYGYMDSIIEFVSNGIVLCLIYDIIINIM